MKVGIDLGGSHIAIGVVDSSGVIIEKIEKRLKNAEKRTIENQLKNILLKMQNC